MAGDAKPAVRCRIWKSTTWNSAAKLGTIQSQICLHFAVLAMPARTQDEEFQTDKFNRRRSPIQVHFCQWLWGPKRHARSICSVSGAGALCGASHRTLGSFLELGKINALQHTVYVIID